MNDIKRLCKCFQVNNGYEIDNLDDNINDTVNMTDFVDENSRDKAFVFLDGEIHTGNQQHVNVIADILKKECGAINVNEDNMIDLVYEYFDSPSLAMGSICGGSAFVSYLDDTTSSDDVITSLQNTGIEKVYIDDFATLTRAARSTPLLNVITNYNMRRQPLHINKSLPLEQQKAIARENYKREYGIYPLEVGVRSL